MPSITVQVVLILVVGAIVMMLIAAKTKRGLEVTRSKFVFWPPDTTREILDRELEEPSRPPKMHGEQ